MSMTFVTALYDLARREPAYTARTVADVLEFGRAYLLRQPISLVVFTDRELVEPIERARAGVPGGTRVVALPLEDLPPWRDLAKIRAARGARPLENGNPRKDVPGYTALVWCKFDLVARTAEGDPFGNRHVAWIDFGIGHVAVPPPGGLEAIAAAPTERVSACSMRHVRPEETANRREFCRFVRGHVCGGFFGGSSETVALVADACREEIRACLAEGVAPSDEHALEAVVSRRRASWFRLYFGDYANLLENYHRVRGGRDLVARSLQAALDARDPDAALEIACALLESESPLDVDVWLRAFEYAFAAGRRDLCERLASLCASERLEARAVGVEALKLRVALAKAKSVRET